MKYKINIILDDPFWIRAAFNITGYQTLNILPPIKYITLQISSPVHEMKNNRLVYSNPLPEDWHMFADSCKQIHVHRIHSYKIGLVGSLLRKCEKGLGPNPVCAKTTVNY